eukprot:COSAG02_NODE_32006_length_523_cov_1.830189_2_plen_28_part_01
MCAACCSSGEHVLLKQIDAATVMFVPRS